MGGGRAVLAQKVTACALGAALDAVLADDAVQQTAQAYARDLDYMDGATLAADMLMARATA
jgi:UDP:flavonoid glycosyltransferase YjiC (YdhE family)